MARLHWITRESPGAREGRYLAPFATRSLQPDGIEPRTRLMIIQVVNSLTHLHARALARVHAAAPSLPDDEQLNQRALRSRANGPRGSLSGRVRSAPDRAQPLKSERARPRAQIAAGARQLIEWNKKVVSSTRLGLTARPSVARERPPPLTHVGTLDAQEAGQRIDTKVGVPSGAKYWNLI